MNNEGGQQQQPFQNRRAFYAVQPNQPQQQSQNQDLMPWETKTVLEMPRNEEFSCFYPPYFRPVSMAIPIDKETYDKVEIPLGITINPALVSDISVIDYSKSSIHRCSKCAAYLSPYIKLLTDGKSYKCPICDEIVHVNEDIIRSHGSLNNFPEIANQVYEMLAPRNYISNPYFTPTFCIIVDAGMYAFDSGFIYNFVESVKTSISQLDDSTRVTLIVSTNTISIFDFDKKEELTLPDLSDLDFPLPMPTMLAECRDSFNNALDSILTRKPTSVGNSYGSALEVCTRIMKLTGGIIIAGMCCRPLEGSHKLEPRYITTKTKEIEILKLNPGKDSSFYRDIGFQLSRCNISVYLFCCVWKDFNLDLATIGVPSGLTGGEVHFYKIDEDDYSKMMYIDIYKTINNDYLYSCSLKLRAQKGVKITRQHGNFSIQSGELIWFPILNPQHAVTYEIEVEESLCVRNAIFQAALLYTTKDKVRMVRVFTFAIPTTQNAAAVIKNVDQMSLSLLIAKSTVFKMIVEAQTEAIKDLKERMKKMRNRNILYPSVNYLMHSFCYSKMLAIIMKSDNRICDAIFYRSINIVNFVLKHYPRLLAMYPSKTDELKLDNSAFEKGTVFLAHMYDRVVIWVSPATDRDYIVNAFGVDLFENIPKELPQLQTEESRQLVEEVNNCNNISRCYLPCSVIKQGDPEECIFAEILVDQNSDRRTPIAQWLDV